MTAADFPRRPNHRGRLVVFPFGVPVALAAVALVCVWIAAGAELGRWPVYLLGVALLGAIDDAFGGSGPRGVRGHGAAVLAGGLSTGIVKALGTAALALYAAGLSPAAGVLLLAPHAGNLLDTAPGRVEKAMSLSLLAVCVAGRADHPLAVLAPFAIPLAAGSWLTLHERAMLGDSGASLAGAVAGAAVVIIGGLPLTIFALCALIAISLYGEFRSLGAAIERIPLTARLDSLGRSS